MKKFISVLYLAAAVSLPLVAQTIDPCTQNTKLTGGTLIQSNSARGNITGTPFHYEIWVDQGGSQGVSLRYFGNQGGGAAFRAEWTNPDTYLGRVGY